MSYIRKRTCWVTIIFWFCTITFTNCFQFLCYWWCMHRNIGMFRRLATWPQRWDFRLILAWNCIHTHILVVGILTRYIHICTTKKLCDWFDAAAIKHLNLLTMILRVMAWHDIWVNACKALAYKYSELYIGNALKTFDNSSQSHSIFTSWYCKTRQFVVWKKCYYFALGTGPNFDSH